LIYFSIGDDLMPIEVIRALAQVKRAAAIVNRELGAIESNVADGIIRAADEIIDGKLDDHFPLRVWQTGSGTQSNMNVNEVIANRAAELTDGTSIHPNDHVNCSHSSNDAFPTAMHIAAALAITKRLIPAVHRVRDAIRKKGREFADVVKIGRTHLQDATPLTVGQEMGGWAALLDRDLSRFDSVLPGLMQLAIGGSAVGTGLNAAPEFGQRVAAEIGEQTGLPFVSHPNKFAAISAHDELVFASGAATTLAASLMKIANDIRLLASGPRCGLGEFLLPANEPGSSMMPGKVNPTQCEAVTMVAVQVFGNNAAIAFAGSQGHLELNAYKPVIIFNLLQSIRLLTDVANGFAEYCIKGIALNRTAIAAHVERSLMLVTALTPRLGHDRAAKLAQFALDRDLTLRDANRHLKFLPEEEFDRLMQPEKMTRSNT
jgi:fumarate hydratase class II